MSERKPLFCQPLRGAIQWYANRGSANDLYLGKLPDGSLYVRPI